MFGDGPKQAVLFLWLPAELNKSAWIWHEISCEILVISLIIRMFFSNAFETEPYSQCLHSQYDSIIQNFDFYLNRHVFQLFHLHFLWDLNISCGLDPRTAGKRTAWSYEWLAQLSWSKSICVITTAQELKQPKTLDICKAKCEDWLYLWQAWTIANSWIRHTTTRTEGRKDLSQ